MIFNIFLAYLMAVVSPVDLCKASLMKSPDAIASEVKDNIRPGTPVKEAVKFLEDNCLEYTYARNNISKDRFEKGSEGVIYSMIRTTSRELITKDYRVEIAVDAKGLVSVVLVKPIFTGP